MIKKPTGETRTTSLFWPDASEIFTGGYGNNEFSVKWWRGESEIVNGVCTYKNLSVIAIIKAENEIIRSLTISPILPNKIIAGDAKGNVFIYHTSLYPASNVAPGNTFPRHITSSFIKRKTRCCSRNTSHP